MKRTLCAFLALTLLIVSGCGASAPQPSAYASPSPRTETAPAPTPTPTPAPTPEPTPEPTPAPVILAETEDAGQEYQDAIVFYGDSNTNGLRLHELLPGGYNTAQVWTPMSGTLTLSRWDIDKIVYPETWTEMDVTEAMALKKPEYLIINLGMNGVSFMDEEYFTETYAAMAEALASASPDTKIILSSIYPIADGYLGKDLTNEKIDAANSWILKIAEDEGLRYLDVQSILKGPDGDLPEEYHDGNGFHLTAGKYQDVLTYIRTHAWQ